MFNMSTIKKYDEDNNSFQLNLRQDKDDYDS